MTNNYRICHVLTPSELFAVICHVSLSVYNRFRQRRCCSVCSLNCGFASVSAEQIE